MMTGLLWADKIGNDNQFILLVFIFVIGAASIVLLVGWLIKTILARMQKSN